jgi:hypothetical protein
MIEIKGLHVDLTTAQWFKSTKSGGNDSCVEVAMVGDAIAVRDSKNPTGPALIYTSDEWTAFLAGVKDGEFDS